jgi:acetyl esterase/lipase
MARDAGGPAIAGQVLVNPVTDCDFSRRSYLDNAQGYLLTASTMQWFWNHYADPADRKNPNASPLRCTNLADLPPALVVTAEFDPLRDEGKAYADALSKSGVAVTHLPCRGQIHSSVMLVDVIFSAVPLREAIASSIRDFHSSCG